LIENISIRTRAIVVSHITSPTALVLPVRRGLRGGAEGGRALDRGRGARARAHPARRRRGSARTSMRARANKWLGAPKGVGFLWARPEHQDWIEPLVVSWGYHEDAGFGERHGWQGTRDPAAYLAVPAAIAVHGTWDLDASKLLADEAERRSPATRSEAPPRRARTADAGAHGEETASRRAPGSSARGASGRDAGVRVGGDDARALLDRPLQRRRRRRAAGRCDAGCPRAVDPRQRDGSTRDRMALRRAGGLCGARRARCLRQPLRVPPGRALLPRRGATSGGGLRRPGRADPAHRPTGERALR
jgi:hypothetical protein